MQKSLKFPNKCAQEISLLSGIPLPFFIFWLQFCTTRKLHDRKLHDRKFQERKLHEWKISWKKIPWWKISWMKVPWIHFSWLENSMNRKFHERKLWERKLQENISSMRENSMSENSRGDFFFKFKVTNLCSHQWGLLTAQQVNLKNNSQGFSRVPQDSLSTEL